MDTYAVFNDESVRRRELSTITKYVNVHMNIWGAGSVLDEASLQS